MAHRLTWRRGPRLPRMLDDQKSDADLMRALVAGRQSVLRTLITRWERPLFSFVYRYVQNEQTTREIIQETFVRLYTKRERYNPEYPLSSWIFTIASNLCKNHARWLRRHPEVPLETEVDRDGEGSKTRDTLPSGAPDPSELAGRNEEIRQLRNAINELPHDLKTAMLLHHYEGLSYKEISSIVSCSVRGVETRLYRARKLLRKRLEKLLSNEQIREKKKLTSPIEPELMRGSVKGWA